MDVSDQLHASAALPWEESSVTCCIGGWAGVRAVLDAVAKGKISLPLLEIHP